MVKSGFNKDNSPIPHRLEDLLAELCDGTAGAEDIAELERLAGTSSSARRYVVHYLHLHGELLWSHGRLGRPESPVVPAGAVPGVPACRFPKSPSPWRRIRSLSAVLLACAVGVVFGGLLSARWLAPTAPQPVRVAEVIDTHGAEWTEKGTLSAFFAGDRARLKRGYAQLRMKSGATVIVEAPAEIRFSKENELHVDSGRLSARVPERAHGFRIATPAATIVDLGTEFGVTARDKDSCEVRVFTGKVAIGSPDLGELKDIHSLRHLNAGEGARVVHSGSGLSFSELLRRGSYYVRQMPPPARFAFREAAARDPALIHQFPFEGLDKADRLRDRRGSLDLLETVMLGGRGDGSLAWGVEGLQPATDAIAIRRSHKHPNKEGIALLSERTFVPPEQMTIELLLRFDGFRTPQEGAVAAALATRADDSDCGFYVTVVEDGQIAHLLDANEAWVETGYVLKTNVWYYVAATFQTLAGNRTRINTYVADLSKDLPTLSHPLKDRVVHGTPAVGRLGVGKGFDETRAHAYPFSGALDEVSVYNTLIDESHLQERLRLLYPTE